MTKPLKVVISLLNIACLVGLLSCIVLSSSNSRDNQDHAKQAEMMALVLEWGRLAPFPASATNISIKTEGSSFTRSFRASFIATKQDIETWMNDSPGINEATPEEISKNKVQYIIEPGGGANWAEVTIDFASDKVEIYVSWE
jgi:hypothetical protein